MYGPLKATSLLGSHTGSLCIRISPPLLCTEPGEMPGIQSSRGTPAAKRDCSVLTNNLLIRGEKNVPTNEWSKTFQYLWTVTVVTAVRTQSAGTISSALESVLWSFSSHLAQCDWSSYHLTPLHSPNIYRPIDTPWGGICTTLHMEMISINDHSPLTAQRGGGETKDPVQ